MHVRFPVPEGLHRRLRVEAARKGVTIQEFAQAAIEYAICASEDATTPDLIDLTVADKITRFARTRDEVGV